MSITPPRAPSPPPHRPDDFQRTLRTVVLPIALAAILLTVCANLWVAASAGRLARAAATPTYKPIRISGVTPLASPTATVAPTSTPPPCKLICDSVLGGTQDAFTSDFGDPELRGKVPWYTYDDGSGTSIEICVCDLEPGTDHHQRVTLLSFYPTGDTTLSPSDALDLATSFFAPDDAHHVRDFTDPDVGKIHVYRSTRLARTFPASDFTNVNTNALVTPGTFSIGCDDPAGPGCTIYLGT